MEHGEYMIDLLNEEGIVVGQKKRKDINREKDILHSVYIVLFTTKKECLLSIVPTATIYGGMLGVTSATFVRQGETSLEAATRSLRNDFGFTEVPLTFLGEKMHTFTGNIRRLSGIYYGFISALNNKDLKRFTRDSLVKEITKGGDFAPSFKTIYLEYEDKWPF
ncbi:MAG TPA: hypothetical protein VEA18_00565 [Candidatus Kapabacteria bacterium]|nr:hypothetical protein [Candidatus Kapabacteria bacterium]